jgi:dihydrofolate synthase / folylpolyglutamate synthase
MKITPVKTRIITAGACTLAQLVDESITSLTQGSVLLVASKAVSLCEGRVVPKTGTDLQALVRQEAAWYMPDAAAQHGYTFTIAHDMLTPNSGIDESNADGQYVLWPADPQASANALRAYLQGRFGLREVAVIITDSNFLPLRWGAVGLCLAYSGLKPVRSYRDAVDLFGRPLKLTRTNITDSLATAATLVMGEGAEQTPLAVAQDIPGAVFTGQDPSPEELAARHTSPAEDSFGPLLTAVKWEPGGQVATGDAPTGGAVAPPA